MSTSKLVVVGAVLLLTAGATACTTARAATPVERPNLDVPPPPPRVIEPAPPSEAPQVEPVSELPPSTPTGTTTRPRPQRDPATAKPETKPEPPPAEPPPATPPPPANPTQLRAPGMASGPETAGEIKGILERANALLHTIDYGKLTKPRQASYNTAKRFADEGEKELKAANYVLAKELAEKAERLAKELQIR